MNNDLFTFGLTVFTGLFAIMNPIANTPIFLGLCEGKDRQSKKRIAKSACFTAFLIVCAFVLLGKYIFELFGITIAAFKITGGILIFHVGFEMLMSRKSKVRTTNEESQEDDDVAISPLAIPILAGPGTIVTAMNNVTHANYIHIAIVVGIFALIIVMTYLAFMGSDKIVDQMGPNIIAVIGKLMGLILAIIGTDMVITGIKLSFKL